MPERSAPGLREVLLLAALVVVAVFVVELLTSWIPALRDLLGQSPVLIAVLAVGTVGLLGLLAVRRPPPG